MAGTGRPICCRRAAPRSIWPTRWGSRCSATSGSRPTPATRPTWPSCCAWTGCPRPGWLRRQVRELRELVRYRAKLVALRSGLKAQVHAVLAKEGVRVPMSDLFGVAGAGCWTSSTLDAPTRCGSPRCAASSPPTTRRSPCLERDRQRSGRRRRLPGHPGHPRGGAGAGGRLRGRDRRRPPLRRRPTSCAPGPGSRPATASPTPPCAAARSPNRAPGWSAGPPSRPPSGCPEAASRPPTSTASPTGAAPASAASPPPASCSPWSSTACATARSAAWPPNGRRCERLGRSPARARVCHDPRLAAWSPV